eukprot:s714_g4.t1
MVQLVEARRQIVAHPRLNQDHRFADMKRSETAAGQNKENSPSKMQIKVNGSPAKVLIKGTAVDASPMLCCKGAILGQCPAFVSRLAVTRGWRQAFQRKKKTRKPNLTLTWNLIYDIYVFFLCRQCPDTFFAATVSKECYYADMQLAGGTTMNAPRSHAEQAAERRISAMSFSDAISRSHPLHQQASEEGSIYGIKSPYAPALYMPQNIRTLLDEHLEGCSEDLRGEEEDHVPQGPPSRGALPDRLEPGGGLVRATRPNLRTLGPWATEVFDPPRSLPLVSMEWITQLFWNLDFLVSLRTGFYKHGALVLDNWKSAMHYMKTWMAFDICLKLGFLLVLGNPQVLCAEF